MKEEVDHAEFEELILQQRLAGRGGFETHPYTAGDAARLQAHLDGCEACRRFGAALEAGLASLASLPIAAPAGLTAATRSRLSRRGAELAEAATRLRLVTIASILAGVMGLVSARVLWLGADWLGRQWELPAGVLVSFFVVVCFVPTTLGGLAAIAARNRQQRLARVVEEG